MGCGSANAFENNYSKEYDYCLRPDEIKFIEQKKKEKEENIKNAKEEGGNNLHPLYRKIEIDFTKKNIILKEYIVIYIPKDYSKNTEKYEFDPALNNLLPNIEKSDSTKYVNCSKLNNINYLITKFELKQNPEVEYPELLAFAEFNITEKEKEKNLITIEVNYNIKFNDKFGFINLGFYGYSEKDSIKQKSFNIIIDDNYIQCSIMKHFFKEITGYKFFAFNQEDFVFNLRDKRIKINMENELDKELLSKFTSDEIKKVNNCLNTMELSYGDRNLIYQKAIHNIQNNKDKIKILDVVFYPHSSLGGASISPSRGEQPIIINEFKINNILLKKRKKYKPEYEEDEEPYEDDDNDDNGDDDEDEDIDDAEDENKIVSGYYYSKKNLIGFSCNFNGIFGIYEYDCESNENLGYLKLNCIDLGDLDKTYIYGLGYKYEIILNGNNLEFCNAKTYEIKNDKIIIEGIIDGNKENFDQNKYEEFASIYNRGNYLDADIEENKIQNWMELKLLDILPERMQLA